VPPLGLQLSNQSMHQANTHTYTSILAALVKNLSIGLVFLHAADIPGSVYEGHADIGITDDEPLSGKIDVFSLRGGKPSC
jgi:ATP phosphoribosyltransferase